MHGQIAHVDRNEFPMPISPRSSPVPEQEGAPLSTQATLIASPVAAEKEPTPARPTSAKVVEPQVSTPKPTIPPSSQQTLVATRERVVPRPRVRGASAQPGPSVPRATRARGSGVATVETPYRNTRARSPSVDPQHQPVSVSESKRPKQRGDEGGRGKGKAREEVLVSTEEDVQVEEAAREVDVEDDDDGSAVVVTGAPSTLEDEMAVEGLLEASMASGDDEDGGSVHSVHDEDENEDSDGDEDEDSDVMPELPRFQEIEIESGPSDSDDAETHGSLVRGGGKEGSVGRGEPESDPDQNRKQTQDQDEPEDSEDEDSDADRIERMANESLHAPTPPQPRVTRSMAVTLRMRTFSPRRTRSGSQAREFPSPGTKARAVVDRLQEEERKAPYVPPAGSHAARVMRGRGRGRRG